MSVAAALRKVAHSSSVCGCRSSVPFSVVMLPTEFQIAVAFGSMIQLISCFVVSVV